MNFPLLPVGTWHSIADAWPQAMWLIDAATLEVIYANRAAGELLGRPVAEMVGRSVHQLASAPQDLLFWEQSATEIAAGIHSCTSIWNPQRGEQIPVERWIQAVPPVQDASSTQGPSLLAMYMQDCSESENSTRELEGLLSQLRATLDCAADGILSCDLQGRIRAFNHRLVQIWKLPDALLRRRDDDAIHAHMQAQVEDVAAYRQSLATLRREPLLEATHVFRLRDSSVVELRSVPQLIHGKPAGRIHVYRDISGQIQAQANLQLAAQVFESSLDAIFIADTRGMLVRINPSGCELLGARQLELLSRPVTAMIDLDRPAASFLRQVEQAWDLQGFWVGDVTLRPGASDSAIPIALSWVALRDERGNVSQSIGFMRDLTTHHAAQRRIEELAFTDPLTGLPNRLQLTQWVGSVIEGARSRSAEFAVLFLDLDRFKIVNDSLGHPFGDQVLKMVAQRLQDCLRQSDMLCRLGGDEFVVYLHDADRKVAEAVARRMLDEMAHPFTLEGMNFSIQGSMGIALYPHDGLTLDDLIKHADSAMYRVKERGRGHYSFYRPQMSADLLPRMKMEHAMRLALGLGHMEVHYQPQVEFATGRIVGMEALLRWRDPELGSVPPAVFIPLAEESGYIVTLGAWVMEQAIKEAAHWHVSGTPMVVSVNVSALEFRQPGLVERISGLLAQHGLPAAMLELELTESVLLQDAQEMEQLLGTLAQLGIGLSIDDFGTGYSSLAYLKKLSIHRLKIDKSFVDGLPLHERDQAIVQAIVSMGRALGIATVAEGVETAAQRDALQAMGCDFYQGYLCAPALPVPQLRTLVGRAGQARQEVSASATEPSS